MTTKEVSDRLRNLKTKTPKTLQFENEIDKDGERVYGQKNRRWWDRIEKQDGMSGQQDHVVTTFICQYYHGAGYPSKCSGKGCSSCYLNESYILENPINDITPESLYENKMKRPEMYLWIIEALEILDDKTLDSCIDAVKNEMDAHPNLRIGKIRDIIRSYVTWNDIVTKLNEL